MKFFAWALSALSIAAVSAQTPRYYPSTYPRILYSSTDTFLNAWAGGMVNPMFGNIDLNGDGLQDIFVFDRADNSADCRVLTFLAVKKGSTEYHYAPEYEHYFPRLAKWAYLCDFNHDGKPDLFCHGAPLGPAYNTALSVYKNTGNGSDTLRFTLYKDMVEKRTSSTNFPVTPMDLSGIELPAITDMDGDGDLDVLTFDPSSAVVVKLYKNMSKERYGNYDSLNYNYWDACWGRFDESSTNHVYTLGHTCSDVLVTHLKNAHAGSTLFAMDMDGDSDKDIVVGDIGFDRLAYLENGRKRFAFPDMPDDSMVQYTNAFPLNNPIQLRNMPMPFLVDVDNDGLKDMLISPMDIDAKLTDIVWYYHNEGTLAKPTFIFGNTTSFLENTMLDFGVWSVPTFIDYDNDGKTDLILGVTTDEANHPADHLVLLKNIGKTKPVFKIENTDYLTISSDNILFPSPAGGDLDGDGKADLVLGNISGTLVYYHNTGTGFTKAASKLKYIDGSGVQVPISIGGYSAPAISDINGDGKNDIILGNNAGVLQYYRWAGNDINGIPVYRMVVDTLKGIPISNASLRQIHPFVADLDKNGKKDLLLGIGDGRVFSYHDFDTTGVLSGNANLFYDYGTGSFGEGKFGNGAAPAAANLDQDSLPDIIVGSRQGGLFLFATKQNKIDYPKQHTGIPKVVTPYPKFRIYPNPAGDVINISYRGLWQSESYEVYFYDLTGKKVLAKRIEAGVDAGSISLDVHSLTNGLYLVNITDLNSEVISSQKVVITR